MTFTIIFSLHPCLLAEIEYWYEGLRIVDEEDINYEDGYENLPPPPELTPSQRRIVELASKNFTTGLVNRGSSHTIYPSNYIHFY